jgi:choline-glycine betaine transporter
MTRAQPGSPSIDPVVFWVSAALSVGFVLWGSVAPASLAAVAGAALAGIIEGFGWTFVVSTALFLAFAVYLACSRFGRIRLGRDDDVPEFSTPSWVAMMFSVGMGIGLMFYGAAEPMSHFAAPPHGLAQPQTREAGVLAIQYAYFHWAFHPWAIYAVVGLALGYFTFRKGKPVLISSAFGPLLGEDRVNGPIGKAIDILAIFATLFGTATSLGLGAKQINSGLNYLFGPGRASASRWPSSR